MKLCTNCCWWGPNQNESSDEFGRGNCLNPRVAIPTYGEFGCVDHVCHLDTEVNVPQHTAKGVDMKPDGIPVNGPVEILVVTHAKDFPWLKYCLMGLRKFCSGFQGIVVAFPTTDWELFLPLSKAFDVRLFPYPEPEGKGMLNHMVVMAQADLIVPESTAYVMHLDSDCIFHTPTTPENYFQEGKPVYLIRSWESLVTEDPRDPRSKIVSDCMQWREPTERQLGIRTDWYTMCRHPTVLPVAFYRKYRDYIELVHKKPFAEVILSGRNEFPQTSMDWTAMGAYARAAMGDQFHWIDIGVHAPPKDRQKTFWSHGGILPEIKKEIEGYLA